MRVSFILAALGIKGDQCIGYLGPFRRKQQITTLKRFGVSRYVDMVSGENLDQSQKIAKDLLSKTIKDSDIISWDLPYNLPGSLVYDYVLKRQNHAYVQLDDQRNAEWVTEMILGAENSMRTISKYNPKLIISSHSVGLCGVMTWLGLRQGVRSLIPHGEFGLNRFWSINSIKEFYNFHERISSEQKKNIPVDVREKIEQLGVRKFKQRVNGGTEDIAAVYAYRGDKENISRGKVCEYYNWDPTKKIIGIFPSCWSDYPHVMGMESFTSFYDFIKGVYDRAELKPKYNWLFKAHPCEAWYGGAKLDDLFDFQKSSHVRSSLTNWSGKNILEVVDSVVTYHGTIGVEAAVMGKPVQTPERGWYGEAGIGESFINKEEFLEKSGRLLAKFK